MGGCAPLGARNPHDRLPGRAQRCRRHRHQLQRADGTGRADPRAHPADQDRVMPGLGLVARVGVAAVRPGRAVRVGVSGATDLRRGSHRRALRSGGRLHRPACLDRGLRSRGGLDRAGSDLGPVRRGGAHSPSRHPAPVLGGPDQWHHRSRRDHLRVLQHRHPDPRGSPGHAALHRHGLGGDHRTGGAGRRPPCGRRRAVDDRRGTHVRLDRRSGRTGMDHRGRRSA